MNAICMTVIYYRKLEGGKVDYQFPIIEKIFGRNGAELNAELVRLREHHNYVKYTEPHVAYLEDTKDWRKGC